jgi:hypothetical protein
MGIPAPDIPYYGLQLHCTEGHHKDSTFWIKDTPFRIGSESGGRSITIPDLHHIRDIFFSKPWSAEKETNISVAFLENACCEEHVIINGEPLTGRVKYSFDETPVHLKIIHNDIVEEFDITFFEYSLYDPSKDPSKSYLKLLCIAGEHEGQTFTLYSGDSIERKRIVFVCMDGEWYVRLLFGPNVLIKIDGEYVTGESVPRAIKNGSRLEICRGGSYTAEFKVIDMETCFGFYK